MFKNINKSSGQASRLLLVLAIVVFVAVIITFLVLRMAQKPQTPVVPDTGTTPAVPLPVYEHTMSNIRLIFKSATDRDGVLLVSEVESNRRSGYLKNLSISNTGAKFIQVTIGAQNMGTENTAKGAWDLGYIIDSKGRKYGALSDYSVQSWLPYPNLCGALLKPAFDPVLCSRIYEVSKESTGLKVIVEAGAPGKLSGFFLDLIVK